MAPTLPLSDRMTNVLMTFIHQHARSLEDEIARAEAAIRALPEIDASTGRDSEARDMLRQLRERVEELRLLASLRDPDRRPPPAAVDPAQRPAARSLRLASVN